MKQILNSKIAKSKRPYLLKHLRQLSTSTSEMKGDVLLIYSSFIVNFLNPEVFPDPSPLLLLKMYAEYIQNVKNVKVQYVYHCCLFLIFDQITMVKEQVFIERLLS